MILEWTLIASVNDEEVLNQTLLRSPVIDKKCQVITKRGFASAGRAYNAGIAEATNKILVFAHQDVYLPHNWLEHLNCALGQLATSDPAWGVLGVYGIARSLEGNGYLHSTGLQKTLGKQFDQPIEVVSLDEMLLVTRRSANLFFDERLPGFHLYGTDLCMEAQRRAMNNYVISAFCIHNSNGIAHLPPSFWKSYFFMQRKWWDYLPLSTPCVTIRGGWRPLIESIVASLRSLLPSSSVGKRCPNPHLLHQVLVHSNDVP